MPRTRANKPARRPDDGITDTLRDALLTLKLRDVDLEWLAEQFTLATTERPAYSEFLERILGHAAAKKRARCIERRIDDSGLNARKTLEAFDWDFQPKLDRAAIKQLATLSFVQRAEDLILTGKTGTGKSHILKALALRACNAEYRVRYARCVDLIAHLYAGLADNTYERRLKSWCRPDLIVIDDVGLGQLKRTDDEPTAAHMLFNLIDLRHHCASTAISSNIKLSAWGKYLGDATLAAAILDRLAETSIRIDIDGPSYRQHLAQARADARRNDSKATKTKQRRNKT